MTCRPLLWIAAAAVSVGAVASTPSIAGAEPAQGWNVTIDEPATEVVATKQLRIEGTAGHILPIGQPDEVTVTVVPQAGLPAACTPQPVDTSVDGRRYSVVVPLPCNGRHQIQVVAHNDALGLSSGDPAIRDVGVAEPAPRPGAPTVVNTPEGGLNVSWPPSSDLDADGSVLRVNTREMSFPAGENQVVLPPSDRNAALSVRMLRWGAGGPGTTVSSEYSVGIQVGLSNPNTPGNTDPPPDPDPPSSDPPAATPPPATPGPSGTAPPSGGSSSVPTRGTGASSTTLPEGYREELPFGAPDDAFVPGAEPSRRPSSEAEERAVSSVAPPGGLVRTSERRSPGLVAPFALGLLMITIAAHIAWYLRRSRPTGGGQVHAT